MYNTQQLLFDKSPFVYHLRRENFVISDSFYANGYTLIDDLKDAHEARQLLELFIAHIDTKHLPLYARFLHGIQLAKADLIPICDDSVETSFQALHFDMGQPIISKIAQTMYLVIGLYFPLEKVAGTAKTRVLNLKGLLSARKWGGAKIVEEKLIGYVKKHGDGWSDVNTYRLQCFARILDAVSGTTELANYRDKTMAEWFRDEKNRDGYTSMKNEYSFYKIRGIAI